MGEILKQFFAEYEARFNKAMGESPEIDIEGMAGAFADCFIEASPTGIACGKNDEQFGPKSLKASSSTEVSGRRA